MKTATKAILGVYGAFVGAWLAGSAYFLANGRDVDPEEGLLPVEAPLPREENAYYLCQKLHELQQTNFSFSVVNDFLNGWTNGPAVLAEMSALASAHSNLFACARRIAACRGCQIPVGTNKMEAVDLFSHHRTARLYQVKARCEALRGDRKAAQATMNELIAFGGAVRRTGMIVGCLIGESFVGTAADQGGRSPIAAPEDCAWRKHLMEVLQEQESSSADLIRAAAGELALAQRYFEGIQTNAVEISNYLLRDGLDCFGWMTRNAGWNGGWNGKFSLDVDPFARIDWEDVDRSCVVAILSCCFGYSRYAFKPVAMFNEIGKHTRIFADKMKETSFDREYAEKWEFGHGDVSPLRENCLGLRLVRFWNINGAYEIHFRGLFAWRAGRLRLACENYRFANGRYPARLEELVPDCIGAIPADPYDDEPIRYNAEHGYFWTPGPDGDFDGKVDFDEDGYPRWRNRSYHFVRLIDMTKCNRPPEKYQPQLYHQRKGGKR